MYAGECRGGRGIGWGIAGGRGKRWRGVAQFREIREVWLNYTCKRHAHAHTCTYTYEDTYADTFTYTHTYVYVYAHIYTHTEREREIVSVDRRRVYNRAPWA